MKKVFTFTIIFFVYLNIYSATLNFDFDKNKLSLNLQTEKFSSLVTLEQKDGLIYTDFLSAFNIRESMFYLGRLDEDGSILSIKSENNSFYYGFLFSLSKKISFSAFLEPHGFSFNLKEDNFTLGLVHFQRKAKDVVSALTKRDILKDSNNPFFINLELKGKANALTVNTKFKTVYDRDYNLYSEFDSDLRLKTDFITFSHRAFISEEKRKYTTKFNSPLSLDIILKTELTNEVFPKPLYGGTSQEIKLEFENEISTKHFYLTVKHKKHYEELSGSVSETDYKVEVKYKNWSLSFKISLDRTYGKKRNLFDSEIGLSINNLEINFVNFQKLYFTYTVKGDNYSLKYDNKKQTYSGNVIFNLKEY